MTTKLPSWALPVSALLRRVGLGAPLARHQYKEVWTAITADEDAAKRTVSGGIDEADYLATGKATLETLRSTVGIGPDDVVLEIGGGVGRVGAQVAPICREWIGCDVSENMLAHMRKRLAGRANTRFVALSGYDLAPIAAASVDVVYSTVVFCHLDEWDRYNYVLDAFRVLRPGGRLYVDNFSLGSDGGWAIFEELRRLPPAKRPPYIGKMSTAEELAVYFARAGFGAVAQKQEGIWIMTWGRKPA